MAWTKQMWVTYTVQKYKYFEDFQNSLTGAGRLTQNRFLVHLRRKQNVIKVKDKSDQYLGSGIWNDPANGGSRTFLLGAGTRFLIQNS